MRRRETLFPYTLGFRVTREQLEAVENFADANCYSLGQAGRAILDAGAEALGLIKRGSETVGR